MLKKAYVNGEPIAREAVSFEFERLVKFYSEHGMSGEEIKKNVEKLLEQAQEQAIGAKLLILRARELGLEGPEGVNELVAKTCAGTPEPEEAEIEAFYRANKESFPERQLVQVSDKIRDCLRHAARGKVLAAFVAELRERARIEYREP